MDECNYKEIDRQLKEQVLFSGLNNEKMLAEIIRELTKCEEKITIYSENVLTWAKRVEAQRAHTAVISSLHEAKNYDAIIQKGTMHRDKRPTTNTLSTRRRYKYCEMGKQVEMMPSIQ